MSRIATLFLGVLPSVVAAAGIVDVPAKHWAQAAVETVVSLGLMQTGPSGKFDGQAPVTRFSLARSLLAMAAMPELAGLADGSEAGPPVEAMLLDVPPGSPHYPAVANALGAGLMETKAERFEGEATLDRYDLAHFLSRVVDFVDTDASGTNVTRVAASSLVLADVPPDHTARQQVEKVLVAGLLTEQKGRFEGASPVTRYQLAMILARVVDLTRETRARDAAAHATAATTAPGVTSPPADPAPPPAEPDPVPPSSGPAPPGDLAGEVRELRQRVAVLLSLARDLDQRAAALEARLGP